MKNRLIALLIGLACVGSMLPSAQAQSFPAKPIRVVVAFPPGAAHDLLARAITAEFGKGFAPGSIAENKPGGGTVIATSDVARAPADGHTLLMVGFPFPLINSMHAQSKIDVRRDFVPIVNVMQAPNALVVRADSPYKTLPELLAFARANPGTVKYASVGAGSSPHLGMELLKRRAGIDLTMVPYKGSAPAVTDLLGGHVDVMFDNLPNVVPRVQSGNMRALVVTSAQRSKMLPDVPTMAEAGVSDYVMNIWFGVAAPAGTPPAVVAALNKELNRLIAMPDFSSKFTRLGLEMVGGGSDQFAKVIADDVGFWGKRQTLQANVTINNLLPGLFDTDTYRKRNVALARSTGKPIEQIDAERLAEIPAGRLGDPEEFGIACAWLCSVHAGYITGQNLLLDGGGYPGVL